MTDSFANYRLAQVACLLEATARKPGNVHRFRDFDDCTYLDFVLSAQQIGGLAIAVGAGVGAAVIQAVTATRKVVNTNTNLGMILLLAPLAAVPRAPLREGLRQVLISTTVRDAQLVYQAIRLANPGGLGKVAEQDVADEPTVTLTEAMSLAADRDLVARQYANGYAEVFDVALPALEGTLRDGWSLETAIVAAHLTLLATVDDTLIVRKRGDVLAAEVRAWAQGVLRAGWPGRAEGVFAFEEFDRWRDVLTDMPETLRRLADLGSRRLVRRSTLWDNRATAIAGNDGGEVSLGYGVMPMDSCPESMVVSETSTSYKVRVSKDYLVFCAGHFITYAGERVRTIARTQLPGRRGGRGRARREPLRIRLHRAQGHDPRPNRRARSPDAAPSAEHVDHGRGRRPELGRSLSG